MKICGIVGLKNSGKTYILQELIAYFIKKNFRVASIKHAHHSFDIDKPNTDSFFHRKAGSQQVIVSSSERWAKITELSGSNEKTLNQLIKELELTDIVLVEGFKNESHFKFEVINNNLDIKKYLFPKLTNIIGIISDIKIETEIKQFKRNNIQMIAEHILKTC